MHVFIKPAENVAGGDVTEGQGFLINVIRFPLAAPGCHQRHAGGWGIRHVEDRVAVHRRLLARHVAVDEHAVARERV
ncbi:MAG: hypothetical protein BWY76_02948 [bacterium ADurb.Bin429]|nr:MAG: hypothetical protein BWY76_02948 [bacterium ADurb.Bin429]